jgi:hypothetical protein
MKIKFFFICFKNLINNLYIKIKIKSFFSQYNIKLKKTLLICEMGGFKFILLKNIVIALSMKLRGYKSHFIVCDGLPEACIQRDIKTSRNIDQWKDKCRTCCNNLEVVLKSFNFSYSKPSSYIDNEDKCKLKRISKEVPLKKIFNFHYQGVDVGKITFHSLKRFFLGRLDSLDDIVSKRDELFYRKYFYASLINTYVAKKTLNVIRPDSFLSSHGCYVDYRPFVSLSVLKKIPSLIWNGGYFKNFFYYSFPLVKKGISQNVINKNLYQDLKINDQKIKRINNFFYLRYKSNENSFNYDLGNKRVLNNYFLEKQLKINKNFKTICLFSHVGFEEPITTSGGGYNRVYESTNEWISDSINIINKVPNVNWLIKFHPGENLYNNSFSSLDYIKKKYNIKKISRNVQIINNLTNINSYELYNIIDHGVTCYGTVGMELPVLGKTAIILGPAHYQNNGFTIDIKSKDQYLYYIKNPYKIPSLTKIQKIRAIRYFYYYMFIKQLSFPFFTKKFSFINSKDTSHFGEINMTKLKELLPGRNNSIDKICNYLMFKKEF